MSPQHSSPAQAASSRRDALQVYVCTEYKSVHLNGYITSSDLRHIVPNGGLKSYSVPPCNTGDRWKITESVFRPQNFPECSGLARPLPGCSSGFLRRIAPINKHIKFNRMNGSPGDPPANRMHISFSQNFNPLVHRLERDLNGMEAGWETTNFNHFLSLRTSSRTELAQARMQGPEINNNSTKNKG
jgi:hypothetical protein